MKILIVEPYFTGSHKRWAEEYKVMSRHDIQTLSLEGRYWKWRMHGGAVTLARKFMEGSAHYDTPDIILATDMLDLTTFLALTRKKTAQTPVAVYFHENQITYPWSPKDRDREKGRDGHYGFINFTTALTADKVFFNSSFHMNIFLSEFKKFLKGFPDHNEVASIKDIEAKSSLLYPGIDFDSLSNSISNDANYTLPTPSKETLTTKTSTPLILWNHRWEFDKNPAEFFRALYTLKEMGLEFELAVLGESFGKVPEEFKEARKRLKEKIIHFGYAKDRAEYARWLKRADIIPVTSNHDFFGCSVVEAVYFGAYPILPKRLAYPEHIPSGLEENHLYTNFDGLMKRLSYAVSNIDEIRGGNNDLRAHIKRYDWKSLTHYTTKPYPGWPWRRPVWRASLLLSSESKHMKSTLVRLALVC